MVYLTFHSFYEVKHESNVDERPYFSRMYFNNTCILEQILAEKEPYLAIYFLVSRQVVRQHG
jgi:hypothetical protein